MSRKIPWIGTSWKMNKTRAEARAFAAALAASPPAQEKSCNLFVIPPFPYIREVADGLKGTRVRVGAQNMHWADHGAWTGEVSPLMLKDCGASLVEIGHSERRTHFAETDKTVALKVEAALKHGLVALVCVGETRSEYEAGNTAAVLERQVRALLSFVAGEARDGIIIAYEPVWSIGEGGTPAAPEFANEQHIRIAELAKSLAGAPLPVLYGGSVNQENCVALAGQSHIDGLFIGRAAWDARDYLGIVSRVTASLA